MCGAIEEKIGLNVLDMEEEDVRALCMKHKIEVAPSMGKGKLIDELFSELGATRADPAHVRDGLPAGDEPAVQEAPRR
jgi:lysyl-tRNA synthetase, class II